MIDASRKMVNLYRLSSEQLSKQDSSALERGRESVVDRECERQRDRETEAQRERERERVWCRETRLDKRTGERLLARL